MSQINLPNTIISGDADNPTRDMANWTTIRDIINGNLDNTNLSASAAIDPSKIDFGDTGAASTIGYAEATADQLAFGSAVTDLTSLSVTVTVPAGGRKVRISGYVRIKPSDLNNVSVLIKESSTVLNNFFFSGSAGYWTIASPVVILTPSAGSHTYKLSASCVSGTLDVGGSATAPNFILVELI